MEQSENIEILKRVGKRLSELRIKQGLSYRKMAQRCNIDHSNISKFEKGETNITVLTLFELAKGLGVEARDILDFH